MAVVVIVENGSGANPNANSFASVVSVSAFAESHLSMPNWAAASSGQRDIAVVMSTRLISRYAKFQGAPTLFTQPLPFPRVGCYDRNGNTIGNNAMPSLLVEAVAEMSEILLGEPRREDNSEVGL